MAPGEAEGGKFIRNIMNVRHLFILCGTFLLFMACKDSPKQKSPFFSKNPNHSYVIAIKSDISVKKEPMEGKLVGLIERGEMCELVDSVNGWYKVRLRTGEEGYVNSEFSKVLSHDSIPKEAFESYCPLAEHRVQYGDLSFRVDGNNVFMARAYISVPEDGDLWKSVYQGATIYYGKIEGNRLFFTRSLSRFDLTLDSLAPSELEEIEPYTAYYSPVERGFIFEGALFKAVDLDEGLNADAPVDEEMEVPHPLSARKGLGLYGSVESVTDNEGKVIRFDKVGNILTIGNGNRTSQTYSYNTGRTEYNVNGFGPYIITYSNHKRSDMRSHEYDTEGSVEYFFDEQDRIIKRKEEVRMTYYTETYTYTGTNLLPDSRNSHDYDETGDYLTTDRYEYLEVDKHGNWLKRKVVRTSKVTEYVDGGEDIVKTETKPERIETQTIKYFN